MISQKSCDQQVNGFREHQKEIPLEEIFVDSLNTYVKSDQTKYCCYFDTKLVDTREKKVIWKGADPSSFVFFSRLKTCLKKKFQILRLSSFDKDERKVIIKN